MAPLNCELIKQWIRRCETDHDSGHGGSGTEMAGQRQLQLQVLNGNNGIRKSFGILLVDVKRKCLVESTVSARYVALSYVWGGACQLQTTASSLQDLKIPGALARHERQIAPTVRDAIHVTESIGERYLWVDSLCIVHDNLVTKHNQISAMGTIYALALVTLIAAASKSAADGISRVSSSTCLEPPHSVFIHQGAGAVCKMKL
jgi:hypothetical protein